jgi:hypothetical protein
MAPGHLPSTPSSRSKHLPVASLQRSQPKATKEKLPRQLQKKIILAFCDNLRNEGSANVVDKLRYLPPLLRVCRFWQEIVAPERFKWIVFDFREVKRLPGKALEECELLDLDKERKRMAGILYIRSIKQITAEQGAIKFWVDGPEGKKRSSAWQKSLIQCSRVFELFSHFELALEGEGAGSHVELCRYFKREYRPHISSPSQARVHCQLTRAMFSQD